MSLSSEFKLRSSLKRVTVSFEHKVIDGEIQIIYINKMLELFHFCRSFLLSFKNSTNLARRIAYV